MNSFHIKVIFVISIIFKNVVNCDINTNEHKDILDRRKTNYKNDILTLTADCFKNGSILLTLFTNEPFTGSMYSRSSVPSNCKTSGNGRNKITKLFFGDPSQCGVTSHIAQDNNSKVMF